MVRKIRTWLAVSMLVVLSCAALGAQQKPTPNEFTPMSAEEQASEVLPATPFVFTAYAIVWLVLIGYVFVLWRRVSKVERELLDVNARLTGPGSRP